MTSRSKICRRCKQEKGLSDGFYEHYQMGDGYLNFCKECVKKRVSGYEKSDRGRVGRAKRQKSPGRRKWQTEYSRKRRRENPEKYKANSLVESAVKCGRLIKKPCEVCGNEKAQAHHDDYGQPLQVRWLCLKHHRECHTQVCDTRGRGVRSASPPAWKGEA